jgi:hypothetical protein
MGASIAWLATVGGLVVAVVGLVFTVVGYFSERKRRKTEEGLRKEDKIEAERLREEDRKVEEERRLKVERAVIVELIRTLNHHNVLTAEIDHITDKFYGTPGRMYDAVTTIRDDSIGAAERELGENHKDVPLLGKMAASCKEYLAELAKYTDKEEFSSGGEAFYQEIRQAHFKFIMSVRDNKFELAERHGIDPEIT